MSIFDPKMKMEAQVDLSEESVETGESHVREEVGTESPLPPPQDLSDSEPTSAVNLALLRVMERVLGLDGSAEREAVERQRLLERLIRKVQPGLGEREVRQRAYEIRDKFRDFSVGQLRELVGPESQGESSVHRDRKRHLDGEESGTSERSLVGEGGDGEGAAREQIDEPVGTELLERKASKSKDDDDDDDDGENVWEQLSELDDTALAKLETEVTTELREKLSRLGMPTGNHE